MLKNATVAEGDFYLHVSHYLHFLSSSPSVGWEAFFLVSECVCVGACGAVELKCCGALSKMISSPKEEQNLNSPAPEERELPASQSVWNNAGQEEGREIFMSR